jgi:hypothetical protein
MKFGEGKSKIGFRNRIGRSGPAITTSALFLRFSFSLVIGIIARKIPEKVPRAILDDAAPGILTAEEAADLLHIARTEDPEMLAYVGAGVGGDRTVSGVRSGDVRHHAVAAFLERDDPGFGTLVLERVLPDHLQHQEEKGRRTSEGKQPVDRADRAKAPPRFREHDITVTKRRVRNTGEIPAVAKRGQVARLPEKSRPHPGFRDVRHEKTRDGCNDDENIRGPRREGRLYPFPEYQKEVGEAEDNAGMQRRDKGGEQQRQRIDSQLHMQGVVRSGCFLLHTDGAAWIGRVSTTRRTLAIGIEVLGIFKRRKIAAPFLHIDGGF